LSELAGKLVVVTGGNGGLGGAVVQTLRDRGATVEVPAIDVTDEAAVTAYYAASPRPWGSVHLVGGFAMAKVTETSLADYEQMHRLNAVSCFLCCREAVRAMRGHGGRIVNVASRAALVPSGGSIAYTASKGEVVTLTQALAAEVLADGILVNAVVPSIIDTPANRASMPGADHAKWPKPQELAEAIAWLVSPANALTSGALVPVYGRA
jgi:NAD(P)-dependent dehydrogenase (short-subunit alcohol dehydrogenase family)